MFGSSEDATRRGDKGNDEAFELKNACIGQSIIFLLLSQLSLSTACSSCRHRGGFPWLKSLLVYQPCSESLTLLIGFFATLVFLHFF